MKKLFPDSEVFTNERPTSITKQQEEQFFKNIAQEIVDNKWGNIVEFVAGDLKEITLYDSGYEIAKELESDGIGMYEIDSSFIEFLEGLYWERNNILKENIKQWVKAHNPKPKYELKTRLKASVDLTHSYPKDTVLYITGLKKETASYLIDRDPERQGGTVIPYELIEQCCTPIE